MKPLFERYGITVVAISKNTVAQAAVQRIADGLSHVLLADPSLTVTDQYGLRHRKGLRFKTVPILGIPFGLPVAFDDMAIPTTVIVDESGIVRWIDQSQDSRLRGDKALIQTALADAFDV